MGETSFSSRNYSVESNYKALEELISGNPKLWSDRYLLATGQMLLRVISAGQSANGVRTLQALAESMIGTMQRQDSILGFGETMGYNFFRGSNDVINVTITANTTAYIPARSVVGSVINVDLINVEELTLNEGETVTFKAKVGILNTESRRLVDTSYKYIRFLNDKISNDVLLYKNDELINYYTSFKDVVQSEADTNYVLLTNAYKSVDVFVINKDISESILASDVFTINFIEYTNLEYSTEDINCTYGDVESAVSVEQGLPPETLESARANIPYFRDTQREVLANRDPRKILQLCLSGTKSTTGRNLNSVHSLLSYKYDDYHLVTDEQLASFKPQLAPRYYFGFCPSDVVQPVMYRTGLDIEVVLKTSDVPLSDIRSQISAMLKKYETLPEIDSIGITSTISLDDMEDTINKLEVNGTKVVKTAYVNLAKTQYNPNTYVDLGRVYYRGDTMVRAVNFQYHTSTPLPTVYNETYTESDQALLETWRLIYGYQPLSPNAYYRTDDIVGTDDTHIYRVHPYYQLPYSQPNWNTTVGELTYYNNFVWLTIKKVAGTTYPAGSYAIKGMIVTPEDSDVSYQLIGFRKQIRDINSPEWLVEEVTEDTRKLTNLWNSYTVFEIGSLNIHV